MSIKDLQIRLTTVGAIRLGRQLISQKGKPYPAKLETFRITSPSRKIVERVAELLGGNVEPWASSRGPQFEVITAAKEMAVRVPPQIVDPFYELWGNGFRSRHCNGETENIRKAPCLCVEEFGERFTQIAPAGKACKPTTRLSLMIADLLGLGAFKLESHGWNAAAELPTLVNALRAAPEPIPGWLEIQVRDDKVFHPDRQGDKQVESRKYGVPVLHIDLLTPAQAFSGQLPAAAQAALSARVDQPALPAGPDRLTPERVVELAAAAKNVAQVQQLWKDAAAAKVLGDDVKAVLTARAAELDPKKAKTAPAPVEPAVDVDADEPDRDTMWAAIEAAAHGRGIPREDLEPHVVAMFGKTSDEINGWQMEQFLAALNAGMVAA